LSKSPRTHLKSNAPNARRARDDSDPPSLPSRDDILQALGAAGAPMPAEELSRALRVKRVAQEAYEGRLAAMERDGQILTNRKGELCVLAKLDLVVGIVQGHADGFGFLVPEDGGDDLFLNAREMHKVLHGDRAVARVSGVDRRGRREGEIVEVLTRANREIVGRLHEERGVYFIVAENRRINQDFLVPPDGVGKAKVGEIVVAEVIEQPTGKNEAAARVTEVLGNATDPGIEIEIALRKHALPFEFGKEVVRQAQRLPAEVRPADRKNREDLTALPLVTIDGETAKDFDDAVYCERKGRNYRLVVAIADVAHYVREGDAIDKEARERGTSVYFPRRVIPMLPEELSNELCSLKPKVDRLCMVCDMDITPQGAIKAYRFYPAVMHSRARLTYTEAWSWLSDPTAAISKEAKALLPHIESLYALYKSLAAARGKRGAIDFDTAELAIQFDEHGKITAIVPAPRNDAHKLIEECMLAANVCAADFLTGRKQVTLFRVHEPPPPDKLAALREFLATSALHLSGGEKPTAADYAKLLDTARDRADFDLLQTVLLRSLSQAQYRPDNEGHFGLAYEAYAHFTSPIRRYPDLLVHRAIKSALASASYTPAGMTWQQLGVHTSMTERRRTRPRATSSTGSRRTTCRTASATSSTASISGVTSFGLFVTLDGLAIDGLVHITELGPRLLPLRRRAPRAGRRALGTQLSSSRPAFASRSRASISSRRRSTSFSRTSSRSRRRRRAPVFAEPLSREDRPRKPRKR
jgi:ribonuclease R